MTNKLRNTLFFHHLISEKNSNVYRREMASAFPFRLSASVEVAPRSTRTISISVSVWLINLFIFLTKLSMTMYIKFYVVISQFLEPPHTILRACAIHSPQLRCSSTDSVIIIVPPQTCNVPLLLLLLVLSFSLACRPVR